MGSTNRFGLTTFDGTTFNLEGAFSNGDRKFLDRVLAALETHDHGGGVRLADPVDQPTAEVTDVGGALPGGRTYYYRVSFLDQFGLETAAAPEVSVSTAAKLSSPQPPDLTAGAAGTLSPGNYFYALTRVKDGYETSLGSPGIITLGSGQNSITLGLPDLDGADAFGIWRQGPADSYYTRIGETVAATAVDDGSIPASDCPTSPSNLPPAGNLTNSTNAITITVPHPDIVGVVDGQVSGWRVYRSQFSGVYESNSLVAEVTTIDPETDALALEWTDTGASGTVGQPLATSRTLTPTVAIQGGGGTQSVVLLESPDTTVWRLVANELGEMVTRTSGVEAPTEATWLSSPDGTTWELGIADTGEMTATSGTPASGDQVYLAGDGPHLPTPDPTADYLLTVNDSGELVTTLI